MNKKVLIFFFTGLFLFAIASYLLYQLRSKPPGLSADPSVYLSAREVSTIQVSADEAARPNTYLNVAEITAIQDRVKAGESPWRAAYERLMSEANQALSQGPYSLIYNGGESDDGGAKFETQLPYCGWTAVDGQKPDCRDSQINPDADRQDYDQASAIGRDVSTLGLAYQFAQNVQDRDRYAEKALSLIRVWCLDAETRMSPHFTSNQSRIELSVSLPGLFYGADLISDYAGWPSDDKVQFEKWVGKMAQSALSWNKPNNFENWRVHLIALAGSFLKDESLLSYAFGRYKELIPLQMDETGRMTKELNRTTSLNYSLYALNAMTQTAELAKHQGVNLYDYLTDDGRGLKLALDYHAQFAASKEPKDWQYEQISPLEADENVALYEMAYAHWSEPSYLAVINYWGRPMTERRVHWNITLTHANQMEGET